METRVAQVIDFLVSGLAANASFRRPDDETYGPDLITVWDGPEFRSSEDHSKSAHVVIGYGGDDPEALEPSAATELVAGPLAAMVRPRDETLTVSCRSICDSGETPKIARDTALAGIEAVANLCRSDPSLGIDASATIGGVVVRAWVTAGTLLQYLEAGYTAEWEFTVTVRTRV